MIQYEKRWYQEQAIQSIFDYFQHNSGNPILAMPTGTGKSLVIAEFIKRVMSTWPTQRMIMLTHVKELIEQNGSKVLDIWPTAPMGIYSAGLKKRDIALPIIFGGIDSVNNLIKRQADISAPSNLKHFGFRDLAIIDECHLVDSKAETRYNFTFNALREINPNMKIIGLSATPYRLKDGLLTNGGIFTDICYDITDFQSFNRLVEEGFISPLVSKRGSVQIDTTDFKIVGGDFNQKQQQTEAEKITFKACQEIVQYAVNDNRKKWLIFASGVEHAEHVAQILQSFGVYARASHSKLDDDTNKEIINQFKFGNLTALVNYGKFTTGFDCPQIDLIGMLRATASPGLWVQMLGRGTRPCAGKRNCLVLDFAGNAARLGPINDVKIPGKKKEGVGGDPPVKYCEDDKLISGEGCGFENHPTAKFCCVCGAEFSFKQKLKATAYTDEVMKTDDVVVKWLDVRKVIYSEHKKDGSPPILKASYYCGLQVFHEFVCLEHNGFAAKKARDWWRQRSEFEPPVMVWQALHTTSDLRTPSRIRVRLDQKYPEILGVEF